VTQGKSRSPLRTLLEELDDRLAGVALDDARFAGLDLDELHRAHGVAGRMQDRVISVMTRLTLEMARRENEHEEG
jgi:hypothetical protein